VKPASRVLLCDSGFGIRSCAHAVRIGSSQDAIALGLTPRAGAIRRASDKPGSLRGRRAGE